MKKPLLAVVLTAAALVALGNVGVKLAGALRQVGLITSTMLPAGESPSVDVAGRVVSPEPASASIETAIRTEPVRAVHAPAALAPERVAPESAVFETADLPGPAFDPEGVLHSAAEADPNVAELLNNTDPTVGAAVRDFVYTLAAPGPSTGSR